MKFLFMQFLFIFEQTEVCHCKFDVTDVSEWVVSQRHIGSEKAVLCH